MENSIDGKNTLRIVAGSFRRVFAQTGSPKPCIPCRDRDPRIMCRSYALGYMRPYSRKKPLGVHAFFYLMMALVLVLYCHSQQRHPFLERMGAHDSFYIFSDHL